MESWEEEDGHMGAGNPKQEETKCSPLGSEASEAAPLPPSMAFPMANSPAFVILTTTNEGGTTVILILQMEKREPKEEWFVQRHTASPWPARGRALPCVTHPPAGLLPLLTLRRRWHEGPNSVTKLPWD